VSKKINFKDVKALAGVLPAILAPGPTAIANIASQALTGKSIAENISNAVQGKGIPPPNTTKNETNKKKKKNGAVGIAYDPAQLGPKNMRVGNYSKGGLVSYKNISHMHTKMCGHK